VLPVSPDRGHSDDRGDVAVIPVRDGAEAAAQCAALAPGRPAVLLAAGPIDDETRRAIAARRAVGVLSSAASLAQLKAAIEAVAAGLFVSDQAPGRALPVGSPPLDPLTGREIEVLELLGKGLTNAELGEALGISVHTAKFHVAQILSKLGAASRAEAVHAGLRLGLIGV
jgi:DNA-binding NarL/FixJ family response regulator